MRSFKFTMISQHLKPESTLDESTHSQVTTGQEIVSICSKIRTFFTSIAFPNVIKSFANFRISNDRTVQGIPSHGVRARWHFGGVEKVRCWKHTEKNTLH